MRPECTPAGPPGELTDTETNDEHRDGHKGGLVADAKGLLDTGNVGRDDTGAESDDEACYGNDHGDVPLERFRPVLWVLRVPLGKANQLVVLPGLPMGKLVRFLHADGRAWILGVYV